MGKIREAFRLSEKEKPTMEFRVDPAVFVRGPSREEREGIGSEGMSFIEIGPRREIEGSPDVMRVQVPTKASWPQPQIVPVRPKQTGPRLAELPRGPRIAPELTAYHQSGQPSGEVYQELARAVIQASQGRGRTNPGSMVFTAVKPQIGATTLVLNLAISAAQAGNRVIAVDANLSRPGVSKKLGLESQPGLTDVLRGSTSLDASLLTTVQERLQILPAGSASAIWADKEDLRDLINNLLQKAELVFVDGPCWDGRAGGVAFGNACGALFLVSEGKESESSPPSDLLLSIPALGLPLAGTILTNW